MFWHISGHGSKNKGLEVDNAFWGFCVLKPIACSLKWHI